MVELVVEQGETGIQFGFGLLEGEHIVAIGELNGFEAAESIRHFFHFFFDAGTEFLIGKHIAFNQVLIELLLGGISNERIAAANIEIDIGERVKPEIFVASIDIDYCHHFEKSRKRAISVASCMISTP